MRAKGWPGARSAPSQGFGGERSGAAMKALASRQIESFKRLAFPGVGLPPRPLLEIVMAVPKRKPSPSRRNMRRSADALKAPTYVEDKDSGELRRPHHVDLKSGMYCGRQMLKPKK